MPLQVGRFGRLPGRVAGPLVTLLGLVLPVMQPALAAADPQAIARDRMVEFQLRAPGRDITHPGVLKAMASVPRHEFVPEDRRDMAYADQPLPIGHGQTISQPYVVAFMTERLDPRPGDKVLEIGTGSGYQAAVLSSLVAEVYSIEIVESLGRRARQTLERLGYDNVKVRIGDGYRGWPDAAPFDAIIVTCAPEAVPAPLIDQLGEEGRLVIPVGSGQDQRIHVLTRRHGRLEKQAELPVRFVPMTGEAMRRGAR